MSPAERRTPDTVDGLYDRMRAQERADRLAQVVQDAVRDARLADALATPEGTPRASNTPPQTAG